MIPSFCPGGETLTISSLPHVGLCLFNIQPASPSASWAGKGKKLSDPKTTTIEPKTKFYFCSRTLDITRTRGRFPK